MNIRSTSKSALFLMELMIAILFFSVAGAVSIQLFVNSHLLSESTVNTNQSILHSQTIAEAFTGTNADILELQKILQASPIGESSLELYFDQDWKACNEAIARFTATVSLRNESGLSYADIVFSDNTGLVLYQLTVSHYLQKTS